MQCPASVSGAETEVVLIYSGFKIHRLSFLHCPLVDLGPIKLFLVLSFHDIEAEKEPTDGWPCGEAESFMGLSSSSKHGIINEDRCAGPCPPHNPR